MWIRSQDRNNLINASDLHINEERKGFYIRSRIDVLGTYSTEEKALKVMDMIHSQLIFYTEKYTKVSPVLVDDQFEPFWKKHEVVFDMPDDKDVEV